MIIAEFINHFRKLGIILWMEGNDLRYSAPTGVLTSDLRILIIEHKAEVIAFLRDTQYSGAAAILSPSVSEDKKPLIAPRTPDEEKLAQIWSQVLGIEQVGIRDNYFELGGDSLSAIRIIARANQDGFTFSPQQLFEKQTIEELTLVMHTERSTFAISPILRVDRESALPLSFAQQRLWILDQLEPEGALAYTIPMVSRLSGLLDVRALEQALAEIVRRHEVLRTTFGMVDDEPVQVIAAPLSVFPLHVVSLQGVSESQQEERAREEVREEIGQVFDLGQGPLFRANLIKLAEKEHILIVTMHHIITDGWSIKLFKRELVSLYNAFVEGKPSPLKEISIQYADYAVWQREQLSGDVLEEQLSYWKQRLDNVPALLAMPTDRARPAVQTFNGSRQEFQFSGGMTEGLKVLSQHTGTTMFMVLLAGLETLLYRYSGQEDFCVGTPIAGRSYANVEGLIGFFVNTIVFRAEMAGDPSFIELLMRVRKQALKTYCHQDLQFEHLVNALDVERDISHSPLFQVMFAFQNLPKEDGEELKWTGLTQHRFSVDDTRATMFDLTLYTWESPQGLKGMAEYNTDLFDESSIVRLLGHFEVLLTGIVADPNQKLSMLPLLPKGEREQLLLEWNNTKVSYPLDKCIHQLFQEQVQRTPDNIAISFEDQSITYCQLNERANQLANYLQKFGVGPDVLVGICVERSLEMVIGLLGILKAGGAYIPLDPAYPNQRLAYMLQDSQTLVVLTQERVQERLAAYEKVVVCLDRDWAIIAQEDTANLNSTAQSTNLAYLIYTSGSTGKPKGVMIPHQNVVNFFTGMDQSLSCGPSDTLLAVTSISFDISVLELFWTLARGARVILLDEQAIISTASMPEHVYSQKQLQFSLFYFASVEPGMDDTADKYRLLFEGAKFADQHDFTAVWTPERHFHAFGGLYPNPSVTSAALAAITQHLQIRAGSVVLPLHQPLRVAEEWSLVDNLSQGRVGIAFASGWHPNDFVFFPEHYADRKAVMFNGIQTIQQLWHGEAITMRGGSGNEIQVSLFPKPVQSQLPTWITAAGDPQTFIKAGEIGANVLTHLLGQNIEAVAEKITLYRRARAQHGYDPNTGCVTLMLHTFIGQDREVVREKIRKPFTSYLRSSIGLIESIAKGLNRPSDFSNAADMEELLTIAFDRYFETSALFGTPDTCASFVDQLHAIGVDEIACLVDFGVETEAVLESLQHLVTLKEMTKNRKMSPEYTLTRQAHEYGATFMQATPSLMQILSLNNHALRVLRSLRSILLGGERLSKALVKNLQSALPARIFNMYGPTETTIWSTMHEVMSGEETISIGQPISNTQIYILDDHLQPLPIGVPGELYIGGAGVARGYLNQPGLTAERFVPNPFATVDHRPEMGLKGSQLTFYPDCAEASRLYRTGDLVRWLSNGNLEFLGRIDHQVKLRGFRIELGEIETVLVQHTNVQDCVAMVREDNPDDKQLVAYIVPEMGREVPSTIELRNFLRDKLPDYMLPAVFVILDHLPMTPNGKVDRKALPTPDRHRTATEQTYVAPRTPIEEKLAQVWSRALRLEQVGIHDDFFLLGGDSMLALRVLSNLARIGLNLTPGQLFKHKTIAELAAILDVTQSTVGVLPLTPSQASLLHSNVLTDHVIAHLFEVTWMEPIWVEAVVRYLNAYHETLRARFVKNGSTWQQIIPSSEGISPFVYIDLSTISVDEHDETVATITQGLQSDFNLTQGNLWRVAFFDLGKHQSCRLFIAAHRIVSDVISLSALYDDFQMAYKQASAGENIQLPAR